MAPLIDLQFYILHVQIILTRAMVQPMGLALVLNMACTP